MINILGKALALVFVGLSVMLMVFAAALYLNAVDFGWKQPARVYRETDARKGGDNVAVPGNFDKREAAARKLARLKRDSVLRLGLAQASFQEVEPFLGDNRLKGDAELARLENGPGAFEIKDIKYDDNGLVLESKDSRQLSFPALIAPVPGINMSYASYLAKLKDVDQRIAAAQDKTLELLKSEEALTLRLIGKMDKDGKQSKVDGAVEKPGWYYLIETEAQAQAALKKELEYIQPLWVKELVDAQNLVNLRERLLRRLQELGDRGYMTQSEFMKKLD